MMRVTLVVLAVLAGMPGSSRAFELERVGNLCGGGQNLFWASRTASVDVSFLKPAQFASYATQAQQRWNQAVSTFDFQSGHGGFCDGSDGVTSMGFSNTVCDGSNFGDAVSITYYQFDARTGQFLDADITFKASDSDLANQALFTQIAMHELGHVLGLAHSDACGDNGRGTLMQAVTFLDDPRLGAPQPDDIAGALTIYPSANPSPTPNDGTVPPGANSCAVASAGTRQPAAANLLLLPLLLVVQLYRLRRARRSR